VSRKFVYEQTHKARTALNNAFLPAAAETEGLFRLTVTKAWLRQVIVALPLICHSSYRGVIEFLRDLLGVVVQFKNEIAARLNKRQLCYAASTAFQTAGVLLSLRRNPPRLN
jgi:hypothetical protein